MEDAYKILGLPSGATEDQIRKAYKQKAKELHPDRNKSPNAHEEFIQLTEAYEFILTSRSSQIPKRRTISPEEWQRRKREEARERARAYAQMRYREFVMSDYYKKTKAVFIIWDHFYLVSSIALLVGVPITGMIIGGITGLILSIVLLAFAAQYWAGIFTEKLEINLPSLWYSIIIVIKTRFFRYMMVTFLNIYLLFRFTLNTDVPTFGLLGLFAGVCLTGYFAASFLALQYKFLTKTLLTLLIIPTVLNGFFFMNFVFSSKPKTEKYVFTHAMRSRGGRHSRGGMERTSYIYLPDGKYDDNQWFRMFFDFDSMKNADQITYNFETGLFGIRVLKSYSFQRLPSDSNFIQ